MLPSLVGVLVFLTPIPWDGRLTIGIGIITTWIKSLMGDYGLSIVVLLTVVTSILTLLGTTFRVAWIQRHVYCKGALRCSAGVVAAKTGRYSVRFDIPVPGRT